MRDQIEKLLQEAAQVKISASKDQKLMEQVVSAATALTHAIKSGGTIYACGNGGSACDAMHLVEELVARFKRERPGIRAMHFLDAATMTCWSNDYDFEGVFERQARTFCRKGDVLCAFSTSGNSKNIIRAAQAARVAEAKVIGFTGQSGGTLSTHTDICLKVPSAATERIQELHITLIHILLELLEHSSEMRGVS